ncbi:protein kinase [uncultured Mesotoga sp.]|nr:protein kinase [uncultured Mesotoga sp.]
MGQLLKEKQRLNVENSGMTCEIMSFLGGGGQGEVYKAKLDGREVAVKWYHPNYLDNDPELRNRLEKLIKNGAPNDRFLWPMDLVTSQDDSKSFGYIMELRESRFKSLIDLMKRRVEPKLHVLTIVGFELAFNFRELHTRGLCYRDISFGNVFFDPKNGEVRICDNDNVDVNGAEGAIGGTPRFMAPEIVRGEALPTTSTDLFSLSVLLFYILMSSHPLEGSNEASIHSFDLHAQRQLYGTNPIFIYDPENTSNRPDPNFHKNAIECWQIYPGFIKDMFTRAFTEGLRNPGSRIMEGEWRKAFVSLRDSVYYCSNCGEENFRDFESTETAACWSCKKQTKTPMSIVIEKNRIAITRDMRLYPHHLDRDSEFNFSKPQAEVARHPTDPNKWGIKNLSSTAWTAKAPDGNELGIDPGRSISIVPGTKINFGNKEGEIIA